MFPIQVAVVPAKKKLFYAGHTENRDTHKINCAVTILSQIRAFIQITFICDCAPVLVSAHFFWPPCSRFGQFSPYRISRRSLYRSLFGLYDVQKGARLGPAGATPLGRAGGREHDILGRQNVSEAAGAAAEHEGRPVESERGRVVARMVRLTDSEKNTRCARGRNAPAAGSATRRRRPCASNPSRRPPRRELSSFPRDRADEIAARPRAAPRGRPVFAPPVPLFPRASLAASDWPDRVRLTAPAPPLPRESAGICTTA